MELSSRNLCLYCEKSFASNLDQENHVERDHKTIIAKGKGSRKSERITKNNSSSENSPFPGCFQCNKKTLRTDDLDSLFTHLLTSHQDAYFGCKCKIRTQDKVSLANHKKICKIGGGKVSRVSEENVPEVRKIVKKLPLTKTNGESKLDSLSDSEENSTAGVARTPLPANAIHKKSDRSKLKNHSKNVNNDRSRHSKSSSSSTTSTSTTRTGEDEYTIPLTRQKLKEPTIISRLGSTQNRNSSNKKSQKTNKATSLTAENKLITPAPLPVTKALRTKASKVLNTITQSNPAEPVESPPKNELSSEFDEDFYKNISQNIRTNINCFIDGKKGRLQQHQRNVFDRISDKSSVPSTSATDSLVEAKSHEKEIHEATNFELSTPFPALLTAEQYGFGDSNPNKNKRHITKNSWKWKWDLIKKYKYVNEGGKIVKKVKQITTGLKDLSQLDMWTQLSMRSRYESLNGVQSDCTLVFNDCLADSLSERTIKTQNIQQLNMILDKCLTPEINIEQLEQTVIKLEPEEKEDQEESVEVDCKIEEAGENELRMLNLVKTNATDTSKPLMSGEWARPRCYICIDCGLKFDLMKSLTEHKNSEHPYVVSAHYEIVGRENLEQELYKNLYLPKKALQTSGFARSLSVNSDSKSNETNEASTSSDNSSKFFADQKEKECSKCLKMIKYSSDSDIYKHILECIEDRVWMQAKRRSKYRRSRRKNRKTPRKSRLSIDQKKPASNATAKDNVDGEISTPSISNPPTPPTELPQSQPKAVIAAVKKPASVESKLNGKVKDGMNIKKFFKVNKSVPTLNPRVIVQVLDIPAVKKPLRSSLRSSVVKATEKSDSESKNSASVEGASSKLEKQEDAGAKKEESEEPNVCVKETSTLEDKKGRVLAPLIISTPEKASTEFPLSSPSNSSLTSPTSNSNVPKKKKKLNDCIAMLTCKIQAKLGVNFFVENEEPAAPELASSESGKSEEKQEIVETIAEKENDHQQKQPSTSFQIESLLKESSSFPFPVQEEVIDLSCKKKIECCESGIEKAEEEDLTLSANFEEAVQSEIKSNEDKVELEVKLDPPPPVEDPPFVAAVIEMAEVLKAEVTEVLKAEVPEVLKAEVVETEKAPKSDEMEEISLLEKVDSEPVEPQEILPQQSEVKPIVEVEPEVEPELEKQEAASVSETYESMKISIPKEKIPNLKQILEQYQVITVNNIKISEEERRAFEEQKNRILQILNKTNSLTRKISKRKGARKAPKRKKPAKKSLRNAKKPEPPKTQPSEVISEPIEEKLEAKIEEVIKTTNRIRCRRLSVVVDPIINLSSFQHKNRKIRLTNNSQQNGFYELLAASEQIFSDNKSVTETKPCEVPLEKVECNEKAEPIEPPTASAVPETVEKSLEMPVEARSASKTRAAKHSVTKLIADEPVIEKSDQVVRTEVPEVTSPPKDSTSAKKARGKKQNMENIEKHVKAPAKISDVAEKFSIEPELNETPLSSNNKSKSKKANTKSKTKKLSPLEEIKVEQSVEVTAVKPSKKKKDARKKPAAKQLDTSLSSDTSNENDIPLAQLIVEPERTVEAVVEGKERLKIIETPQKELPKEEKEVENLEKAPEVVPIEIAQDPPPQIVEVKAEEPKLPEIAKHQPIYSKASSMIDHCDKKSFDFTINEDSFFNDDIENDPSDKINDIVNNIINSSEFQIDSDTEKSDNFSFKEQSPSKPQTLSSCSICKRTFRSDNGYEKHCLTPTHILKVQRKNRCSEMLAEKEEAKVGALVVEKAPSPTFDETKIFRTKGALKTFDGILEIPSCIEVERERLVIEKLETKAEPPKLELSRDQKLLQENDDKLYYEFKMEKKPEDMTPKDKDQLFDSLFSSLEVKSHESTKFSAPKSLTPLATPQDSEMESSSASWDLKQDADIEWDGEPPSDNLPFANAIKECYPKKFPVKINKSKDTAVSIPTKSLIMGKIFKKHRDSEKQKTPQADAPNNKPGIKNSLDEIFDHLKNSAEIDDKVLTCPSPKTLLKSAGGTFSPQSTTSSDMIETASQSNNNNNNVYKTKPARVIAEKEPRKVVASRIATPVAANDTAALDVDDSSGKRKSRRRCAIKAKTFAETWSSDEYEELHDTEDIISIINEIEKRDLIRKRKLPKPDDVLKKVEGKSEVAKIENHIDKKLAEEQMQIRKQVERIEERSEKRKSLQTKLDAKVEKSSASFQIRKRRMSVKDGHRSDEETFTATKDDLKPLKAAVPMKKRRMSCFVPSTTTFEEKPKPVAAPKQHVLRMEMETLRKFEKANESFDIKPKASKRSDSEKSFKNQKKFASLLSNYGCQLSDKKKSQKHRKRNRNRVKNIAYDSDSDFELHLKKSKASAISESSSSEEENEEVKADVIVTKMHSKSHQPIPSTTSRGNANDMTMITEPKLLPNDLKQVVTATTTNSKAAIPEDVTDSSQNPCNRTKRHSSEKLYYWSSSSSESDQEQADTADGENEESVVPHQPEQHGWIVGDSHKKLVTLLAHAKIKNKIN